jgi:hypothetical protein
MDDSSTITLPSCQNCDWPVCDHAHTLGEDLVQILKDSKCPCCERQLTRKALESIDRLQLDFRKLFEPEALPDSGLVPSEPPDSGPARTLSASCLAGPDS